MLLMSSETSFDVARDPQPVAVGREVERVVGVGPEDEHAVARAGAAVDPVVAVARAPGEAVEVAAQVDDIVALAALDEVEVVPAEQHVVARAAEHRAAAVAGIQGDLHRVGGGAEQVVAAAAVEAQPVRPLRVVDLHERGAEDEHGVGRAEDQ
jgi:hypothetical protein